MNNPAERAARRIAEDCGVDVDAHSAGIINIIEEEYAPVMVELAEAKAENEKLREYAEGLSQGWSEAEGGRVATFYGRLKHKEKEEGDNE